MQLLLALFLFLASGLQNVQTDNQTSSEEALKCYVCEGENSFACNHSETCNAADKQCVIAVTKIFPRFFLVSKQCARFCTAIEKRPDDSGKQFLLEKPTPFAYVRCCPGHLCNMDGPDLPLDTFREQAGKAHERRCSHTVSALLTVMSTAFSGLGML